MNKGHIYKLNLSANKIYGLIDETNTAIRNFIKLSIIQIIDERDHFRFEPLINSIPTAARFSNRENASDKPSFTLHKRKQ